MRKLRLKKRTNCSSINKCWLLIALIAMSHLCSPHKWPMEIGHHKWPLKAIVVPNAKHEGYNWSFWRSRVVTKFNWSRVRTTQIPLFSFKTKNWSFLIVTIRQVLKEEIFRPEILRMCQLETFKLSQDLGRQMQSLTNAVNQPTGCPKRF